jgi:ribosomal protein S14
VPLGALGRQAFEEFAQEGRLVGANRARAI